MNFFCLRVHSSTIADMRNYIWSDKYVTIPVCGQRHQDIFTILNGIVADPIKKTETNDRGDPLL
jgi:hypothetical protein